MGVILFYQPLETYINCYNAWLKNRKIFKNQAFFKYIIIIIIFFFFLICGSGCCPVLQLGEQAIWPLLVAPVMAQGSLPSSACRAADLPPDPLVPSGDAAKRSSSCSRNPGLAKRGAGGCINADLMNRKRSDTILTHASSDSDLRSHSFDFFPCL